MAKYQRYAEYKDSGVEWLGDIPKDWVSTQVKYGYTVVLGKMLQTTPKSNSDLLKPYLKAQNIQSSGIDLTNVGLMWFSFEERKRLLLKKKDILVSEGGDVGRAAIWDNEIDECYIQNAINRVRPRYTNDSRFFYYWINFLKATDFINIICNKATIAHYTADKLQGSPLILPSALEQTKIANFLDHETAQIDTLIEKQQTLIQLLKEKRQAVISHAVTKGLNPDAPMKDTGVEWLGEVPEHWSITRIKYVAELTPSKSGILSRLEERCSFIPMEKLKLDTLVLDETRQIKDVYQGYTYFEDGDVLIAKVTPCFENQNMAIAANLVNGIGFGSSEIYVLRAEAEVLNQFLLYRLQESVFMQLGAGAMTGAGGLRRVPSDFLNNFQFGLPPISEQQEIVEHIEKMKSKFNDLIDNAEQAIQLMQERRTALISAAVTGKIDVRGWVASE